MKIKDIKQQGKTQISFWMDSDVVKYLKTENPNVTFSFLLNEVLRSVMNDAVDMKSEQEKAQ